MTEDKETLLFYSAYEDFYDMAAQSEVFKRYCKAVFGKDFSQDGFSDLSQIEDILQIAKLNNSSRVLDIGCGNGKMLQHIHETSGAHVSGFDYADKAIAYAKEKIDDGSGSFEFECAAIGGIQYPKGSFDLITAIDTVYFAPDMKAFVEQVYSWLKPGGLFICGYQEGDVMPKTENKDSTMLAVALRELQIKYEVLDYTEQTYNLLLHKRRIAQEMKSDFVKDGIKMWYEVAKSQSLGRTVSLSKYAKGNSRYLYIVKKI